MPRRSLLTARSSHARGSNAIFAAILSARCAATLTAGCATDVGTGGRLFSLAADCQRMEAAHALALVAPASCLRSSGGVHAADGCHTRTSMSARWLSPTVGLSSLAERRPVTHFKPFRFRWNVHPVFRRGGESIASVTSIPRRTLKSRLIAAIPASIFARAETFAE